MRKTVDWEAVELRYRTGTESLRSIGTAFGITEGAIRQRAKKESWSRDLTARVKQATEAVVLRRAATHDVRNERTAIAVEAEMRADVILRHRGDITRLRNLFCLQLADVEAASTTEGRDVMAKLIAEASPVEGETEQTAGMRRANARKSLDRLLSMSDRIDAAKRLTEMLEKLIRMERESFGMKSDEGPDMDNPVASLLADLMKQRSAPPIVEQDAG